MRRAVFFVLVFVTFLFFDVPLYATYLGATGGWTNLVIDSSYLQGGAGTDLQGSYTSGVGATTISITGTSGEWQVQVRKVEEGSNLWPNGVSLSVRRTGEGSGGGTITGGDSYISVTRRDVVFFEGTGDKTAIPVQYKISGMSVSVPPDTYSTTLTFTVVDVTW